MKFEFLPACLLAATAFGGVGAETTSAPTPSPAPQPTAPFSGPGSIEVCVFGSPDVPTKELVSNQTILSNEVFRYDGNPPSYTKVLTLPVDVHVAGIFRLDTANSWLVTTESPSTFGGALPAAAEPRDVIKRDGSGAFSRYFCGASVSGVVPATSRIDALYLTGGDGGDLVVSFDVPTIIGGRVFEPTDLVRYTRTGGGTCSSWQLDPGPLVFDGSAVGDGVPIQSNSVGASYYGGKYTFSQDVPTLLSPPGIETVPGQMVQWTGSQYAILATLSGWPISSAFHGISNPGNPGAIGSGLRIDKSSTQLGNVVVSWTPSCSANGPRTAIYEGTLGVWYSHTWATCSDVGNDKHEEITPGAGNRYFLVVPMNPQGEGSYGTRSNGLERPRGTDPCTPAQVLAACPS